MPGEFHSVAGMIGGRGVLMAAGLIRVNDIGCRSACASRRNASVNL